MSGDIEYEYLKILFKDDSEIIETTTRNKYSTYKLNSGEILRLEIVHSHPLWGHYIWNASMAISKYIEMNPAIVMNKNILELGSGAGLPSIVSSLCHSNLVVATEYPEDALLSTLEKNLSNNCDNSTFKIVSFKWGDANGINKLISITPDNKGYDVIIMSDLLFNHSQHIALLKSCSQLLANNIDSSIYCIFSHHIPAKANKDLKFFSLARHDSLDTSDHVIGYEEYDQFKVEFLHKEIHKPMFENDPGDDVVRSTVFFYKLTRANNQ